MIKQLNIKNFLTFKELTIDPLKRVNLIAGKNNSGKTALLEALRILTSEGQISVINNIIKNRGSYIQGRSTIFESLINKSSSSKFFSINTIAIEAKEENNYLDGYFLTFSNSRRKPRQLDPGISPNNPLDNAVFIPYTSDYDTLSELWDAIALTPREDDVNSIIRDSIEPRLMRFDIGSNQVKIKLRGLENPVPLKSLGDGVQRIFLIALSLANAKGKYLLIDEIELGLHHSVIEKLWEMIFKYAKEWDIQVFATTHSQDAIKTFYYAASSSNNIEEAELIRLQVGKNGDNEAIIYDGERLAKSLDLELETR